QRRVQPAQGARTVTVRGERADRALGLLLAAVEQLVEADRERLDIELDRLAGLQAPGELAERVADLLALDRRHHQRVLRGGAQEPHKSALASDNEALAVDRLDGAEISRVRRVVAMAGGRQTSHSSAPSLGSASLARVMLGRWASASTT